MKKKNFSYMFAAVGSIFGGLVGIYYGSTMTRGFESEWWVPYAITATGIAMFIYVWLNRNK